MPRITRHPIEDRLAVVVLVCLEPMVRHTKLMSLHRLIPVRGNVRRISLLVHMPRNIVIAMLLFVVPRLLTLPHPSPVGNSRFMFLWQHGRANVIRRVWSVAMATNR